jgi:hypothetical protein
LSSVLLRTKKKECSEHSEDQVRKKAERGEISVELPVARSDGEDFEDREDAYTEDVDRSHIEIVSLIDLTQFANLVGVEVFLSRAVPEHVLDVKRITVGCFENFPSVQFGVDDMQWIVLEEIVDQLNAKTFWKMLQVDLGERCPDALEKKFSFICTTAAQMSAMFKRVSRNFC